jgi:outer membrane protein OmpA-like peptidoglycan-associated protein
MNSPIRCILALALLWNTAAIALDFGDRTPSVNELTDALAPPLVGKGFRPNNGTGAAKSSAVSMRIEFELASAKIRADQDAKLTNLAEALNGEQLRALSFHTVGHTDSTGTLEQNMRLSKERANSVVAFLVSHGVDASRLSAEGKGPNEPLPDLHADSAKQRRVDVVLQTP